MIAELQANTPNIVVESALESALLMALVLAFLHSFKVKSPSVRAIAFILPLFVPVMLTTISHVILPGRPASMQHFKPLGTFFRGHLTTSVPLLVLFVVTGIAGVAASVALLWRQGLAWARVRRLWRLQRDEDLPLHRRCETMMTGLASKLGCRSPRLVFVEDRGAGSLALGWGGYVFVPRAVAAQLDDDELEALLAHEIGHIVRKDGLLGCVARMCRNLMLFNPMAQWALRNFETEQEEATDALAVRTGSNRLALASCLLKGYRQKQATGIAGIGLIGGHTALERRVRRILNAPESGLSPRVAGLALGLLGGMAAVIFALVL